MDNVSELYVSTTQEKQKKYKITMILRFLSTIFLTLLIIFQPPEAERWWIAGVVFVFLAHLSILWNFIQFCRDKEDLHKATKIYMTCFFFLLITFGLFASEKLEEVSKAVNKAMERPGKSSANSREATQQVSSNAPVPAKEPPLQTLSLIPGENFQGVQPTYGHTVIDRIVGECPQGCIFEVEHDGDQICSGDGNLVTDRRGNRWYWGLYQGANCMTTAFPGPQAGVIRYRERFLHEPGSKPKYPVNLRRVIFSYGASWGIDPREPGFGPVLAQYRLYSR